MNSSSVERKAKTVVEISGSAIETVPAGTEFIVIGDESNSYFACRGIGISSIWKDEFVFI